MEGKSPWPHEAADRDVLYFLAQSFRAQLVKNLPVDRGALADHHKQLAHRAKGLIKDLASISLEMAQMVVSRGESGEELPTLLLVEVVRDLPRLAERKEKP